MGIVFSITIDCKPLKSLWCHMNHASPPVRVAAKALGIEVEMPGGKGITIPRPLKDPQDFEARIPKEVDTKAKLSHVIQAVVRIKQVMGDRRSLLPMR